VQEARDFSIAELGMPDNGSYRSYADLERDYVVWSVFAAPELSLEPVSWCFPVVGCVAYRGYFHHEAALDEARKLRQQGYDVYVAGVPAYSTLGRFDDPVLNTMLRWDELQLVSTLFHELAHQLLYVPGDTAFNESFASAVEDIGVERFLHSRSSDAALEAYRQREARWREVMGLIGDARSDLETYYAENLDDDEKRLLKEHRLEALAGDLNLLYAEQGMTTPSLTDARWNNARILSVNLYDQWTGAFREMYMQCGERLECFYAEAERVSTLDREARTAYLETLATRSATAVGSMAAISSLRRRVLPVSRQ
jgi:predicted aminopeptidase